MGFYESLQMLKDKISILQFISRCSMRNTFHLTLVQILGLIQKTDPNAQVKDPISSIYILVIISFQETSLLPQIPSAKLFPY